MGIANCAKLENIDSVNEFRLFIEGGAYFIGVMAKALNFIGSRQKSDRQEFISDCIFLSGFSIEFPSGHGRQHAAGVRDGMLMKNIAFLFDCVPTGVPQKSGSCGVPDFTSRP